MMAYEQRDLTGSLFKNDKRETDSHPLYKGSALIGGVEYWMDSWLNESAGGVKYMSLKFKPKEAQRTSVGNSQDFERPTPELDDDVPF